MALLPLLGAELDRPYAPIIPASDASPAYGFGTSVCSCSQEDAAELGRVSERRGDFVRLRAGPDDELKKNRLGKPHLPNVRQCDFTDILYIKVRIIEHSGIMEMRTLLVTVSWALRSKSRQNTQLVVLVDVKVVIGAEYKGRSSSTPLLYVLQQLSALLLASGVQLRFEVSVRPKRGQSVRWPISG